MTTYSAVIAYLLLTVLGSLFLALYAWQRCNISDTSGLPSNRSACYASPAGHALLNPLLSTSMLLPGLAGAIQRQRRISHFLQELKT
jgi:hypothetical protein